MWLIIGIAMLAALLVLLIWSGSGPRDPSNRGSEGIGIDGAGPREHHPGEGP